MVMRNVQLTQLPKKEEHKGGTGWGNDAANCMKLAPAKVFEDTWHSWGPQEPGYREDKRKHHIKDLRRRPEHGIRKGVNRVE